MLWSDNLVGIQNSFPSARGHLFCDEAKVVNIHRRIRQIWLYKQDMNVKKFKCPSSVFLGYLLEPNIEGW
jgi:hypothetical protein